MAGPGVPLPPVPHSRVLLQRGAQRGDLLRQPLQDRVLHLGLVGAVKALEGVGRIQGINLGGAAGGRLEGGVQRRAAPQDTLVALETGFNSRFNSQLDLNDAQSNSWALVCQLWLHGMLPTHV